MLPTIKKKKKIGYQKVSYLIKTIGFVVPTAMYGGNVKVFFFGLFYRTMNLNRIFVLKRLIYGLVLTD